MSIIDELISGTSPECFKYILETEIAKQNEILMKVIVNKNDQKQASN